MKMANININSIFSHVMNEVVELKNLAQYTGVQIINKKY